MFPAACCLAALSLAQPPAGKEDTRPVQDRLLDLKPAPADPADGPVRKLLKERYNARLLAVPLQKQVVGAGLVTPEQMTRLVMALAENAADLEENPADRVKWMRLRVDLLKEQEQEAWARAKAKSPRTPGEAPLATAARADAELDLLMFQEFLKKDPPPKGKR